MNFVQELYEAPLPGLQLEEVDISADDHYWLITVGFDRDAELNSQSAVHAWLVQAEAGPHVRTYKIVEVDRHTGMAKSMKIRSLATA